MNFAVIGGDMRQVNLSSYLAEDGHHVRVFALDRGDTGDKIKKSETIAAAMENADCVILPLPALAKENILNTPLSRGIHTLDEVMSAAREDQVICAGKIDGTVKAAFAKKGIKIIDYLDREEFAVANAVATAEGAIQILMEELPITIHGAKCLVIGFGRIGKALTARLAGLGANVSASARKCSDIAWIKAYGYKAEETQRLRGKLSGYDAVINTVPAYILSGELLGELKKDCLCLDLASKPGGVDFSEASKLGLKTIWALSLPGEVAPASSGRAMADTIYNIIKEQGCEDEKR